MERVKSGLFVKYGEVFPRQVRILEQLSEDQTGFSLIVGVVSDESLL